MLIPAGDDGLTRPGEARGAGRWPRLKGLTLTRTPSAILGVVKHLLAPNLGIYIIGSCSCGPGWCHPLAAQQHGPDVRERTQIGSGESEDPVERRAGRCGQTPPMADAEHNADLPVERIGARGGWTYGVRSKAGPGESGSGMRVPSGWARDTSRDVTVVRGWARPSRTLGGQPGGPGLERRRSHPLEVRRDPRASWWRQLV